MIYCNHPINEQNVSYSIYSAKWLIKWKYHGAQISGISLYQLMQRASEVSFRRINWLYPFSRHWIILAGQSDNGGNGYMVALHAAIAGKRVTVIACTNNLSIETQQAKNTWLAHGGEVKPSDESWPKDIDIIVDAMLGIEQQTSPCQPYSTLISIANHYHAPIISLDIPSGLIADTGYIPGKVIKANHTQTFIALKLGLLIGKARCVVGQLYCDDLGLGKALHKNLPLMIRLTEKTLPNLIPPRNPCFHKGNNGNLLIIGGDLGFCGAIRMTGEASLRAGAGLVKILTREEHISALLISRPELMVNKLTKFSQNEGMKWADVIVIGPGLGQKEWGKSIIHLLKNYKKPMLWDADALNLLACNPDKNHNRIITPHFKEAARLLKTSVNHIEQDIFLAAKKLAKIYGGVVVLKGPGTLLVSDNGPISIADVGNSGMASGGMGDVLSGIIGSFLAQNLSLYNAACAGCVVHGATADKIAKKKGTRGMLATDLLTELYQFINF